jgi:nucleolar pre-ribosomal-associated protein 1
MRLAISSVIVRVLSDSILFQEDVEEPEQWLACLPTSRRAAGAEASDGAALTDEGRSVIEFLDDCVQRCLKTPYRYIEELQILAQAQINSSDDPNEAVAGHPSELPSPLLITIIEQLDAKLASNFLSASDTLAIACFIRKLAFRLSSKQQSLKFLQAVADKVDGVLLQDRLFSQYPCISMAIRREVDIMHFSLRHFRGPRASQPASTNKIVQDFLNQVEQLPICKYHYPSYS